MHTLRQVEADIQKQLVEYQLSFEQKLKEAVRISEESAFRRAEELLAPQTRDLRARLDSEVPSLRQRLEEIHRICQEETSTTRGRFEENAQFVNTALADVNVSIPLMRDLLSTNTESIKQLEEFHPAFRKELAEVREESQRLSNGLRMELENETRLAEGREVANMRVMQERIDDAKALMHSVDQSARGQVSTAINSIGIMEKHLLLRMEDTCKFAESEARKYAEDAKDWLRPEILEARDLMQDRLDEGLKRIDVRAAATEAQLRGEVAMSMGDIIEKCERTAELRMAQVSMSLSEGLETARRDLRAQGEKQQGLSRKWKEQLQEATERLDSVAAAARLSCEQIHLHASKQLALASSQLRGDLAKERAAIDEAIAAVRVDLDTKAANTDVVKRCDAVEASAKDAKERVATLEANHGGLKAWLTRETTALSDGYRHVHSEASDVKQRLQRENAALGSELSHVRAATTSLTHGVLRTLQILGFLTDLPQSGCEASRGNRWGVDVEDLVEWEKAGRSLADCVSEKWSSVAPPGAPTMLELTLRKADDAELKMLRHSLNNLQKPWTPSTAAGFSENSPIPFPSPDVMSGFAEGFRSPFSASSPSPPPRPNSTLPTVVSGIRSCDFNRTF